MPSPKIKSSDIERISPDAESYSDLSDLITSYVRFHEPNSTYANNKNPSKMLQFLTNYCPEFIDKEKLVKVSVEGPRRKTTHLATLDETHYRQIEDFLKDMKQDDFVVRQKKNGVKKSASQAREPITYQLPPYLIYIVSARADYKGVEESEIIEDVLREKFKSLIED